MYQVLMIVHVLIALAIVGLVMLQQGRGADAGAELDKILGRLRWAMTSFCLKPTPSMDKPIGARDMGFWEPDSVAGLSQYQGVSATPK